MSLGLQECKSVLTDNNVLSFWRGHSDGERMPDESADCSMPKESSLGFQRGGSGYFDQGQPDQDFYMDDGEKFGPTTPLDGREAQHFACSPDANIHTAVEPIDGRLDWGEVRFLACCFRSDC